MIFKKCLVAGLIAMALGMPLSPHASALDKGQAAPEIALTDLSGKPVKLSALRGKVVLVDFWASWCGPCRESLPVLDRLAKSYGDKGLVVLGVNIDDDVAAAKAFLAKNKLDLSFAVVNDKGKKVAAQYQPPTMPSSYLIDQNGRVVRVHEGFRSGDAEKLEGELKALLH